MWKKMQRIHKKLKYIDNASNKLSLSKIKINIFYHKKKYKIEINNYPYEWIFVTRVKINNKNNVIKYIFGYEIKLYIIERARSK